MTDFETQLAITDIHRFFELQLESIINLNRVTAPLFVKSGTGINDNLTPNDPFCSVTKLPSTYG